MSNATKGTLTGITLILLTFLLHACARPETGQIAAERGTAATAHDAERLLGWQRPPIIAAADVRTVRVARLTAERIRWNELRRRLDRTRYHTDTLPFLTATPEGRAFLAAPRGRVLARGMPEAICPAAVTVTRPAGTSLGDLVGAGLDACIAALEPEHPGCGCRVVAIEDMLTVPAEDMAYATGVAARLRIDGADSLLVADHDETGADILRDLRGTVARIGRGPEHAVTIAFADGATFEGHSRPVGFRRGRIAERIYATDQRGRSLSLLIGFSPDELAQSAARWLAWPGDAGPRLAGG